MSDISYESAFKSCVEYFKGDELAATVFLTKYALVDEGKLEEATPDDMHRRLAKEFSRVESKYPNPMSEDEIFSLFKDFKYVVPQGSPMSGIGNPHQIQSISNCFVVESPHDSYGGILKTDQELVQIAKRRGGIGFDISTIRPKGMPTGNCARTTDGIEVFMDRFSNSCREVAQGGRRGALMLTISVHHPQVLDFVKIKRALTRVTGANISVRLSDEFMNAVKRGSDYEVRWPVDSKTPVVSNKVSATEVWDAIIENAHASAEPGLLFWDTAKKMTPSDIYEKEGFGSVSTNPCGEIILSPYDSCRLMLLNLTAFIKNPFTPQAFFDQEDFGKKVQQAQRLMDDMIDIEIEQVDRILTKIEEDPEPDEVKRIEKNLWTKIREQAMNGRRTGLGVTAVGDALAMMGLKYGSEESIDAVEVFYREMALNAYRASCIMAKERGAFLVHDHKREVGHEFLERIWSADKTGELRSLSEKYGRRNIAITTTAPAGSVSVLTQTTSGIEPAFMLAYTRRKKINTDAEPNARVDFVDDIGDKWQEFTVYHHKFKEWMDTLGTETTAFSTTNDLVARSPYNGSTANEIDWVAKVKLQSAAQKWVCHAISNTTNLPNDTDIDTVKNVYMTGWETGCKGVTIYRDGCRTGVLVSTESKDKAESTSEIVERSAPKRPQTLKCEIHHVNIKREKWTILVGLLEGRPYEVMGGLAELVEIPKKYTTGQITKRDSKSSNSIYDLRLGDGADELVIKDIVRVFDNPNHAGFTRTISLSLRHGVPIQYLVEQLQKDKDYDLFSFARVISRVLKKFITDGTQSSLKACVSCGAEGSIVYQEGCETCKSCGSSKCG
jgi:ribonucleoside-diphosphate reductase alpha chain